MRLINFRPVAFAAGGLITGVLFAYCVKFGHVVSALAAGAAGVLLFVLSVFFSSVKLKGAAKAAWFLIFIVCALVGGLRFYAVTDNYENASLNGHELAVCGRISEITVCENYSYGVLTDVRFSGAVNGTSNYKLAFTVRGENGLRLGDVMEFSAVIKDGTLIRDGAFSASAVADGVKFYAQPNAADITVSVRQPNAFEICNLYIFDALKAGTGESVFPVAYAMLTGNSDYISQEVAGVYRNLGVAHIFAVSGLHIGFLATAFYFALNKCRVNSAVAFIVTFAVCLFYSGVCGFSASSLRAVIMFFFLNLARVFGWKYDGLTSIAAAAFVILIASPVRLFCVGFQLSFAVAGAVMILYNPLKKSFSFLPEKIAASISVSVSAEIGGLPVLLYAFGGFPPFSFLINILFVPIIGAVFILLFVCTVIGGAVAPAVFLFLPNYALFGINFVLTAISVKSVLIGGFTFGAFTAFYYGAVCVAAGLINLRKTLKITVSVILVVICVSGTVIRFGVKNGQTRAAVIGSDSVSAVLFESGGEGLLVISDVEYRTFSQYRLKKAAGKCGKLSVVLLKSGGVDLQVLLHRLLTVAPVSALYYYGEKDETAESVICATYDGVSVLNLNDGDGASFRRSAWKYALDGKCFAFEINGYNIAVFSSLYGESCSGLAVPPDTVICCDSFDGIALAYSPERMVSFRRYADFPDGETRGNFIFTAG